jgi:hypothetical protein
MRPAILYAGEVQSGMTTPVPRCCQEYNQVFVACHFGPAVQVVFTGADKYQPVARTWSLKYGVAE